MRSFFGDGQRRAGWPAPPQQLHSISIEMAPSASHATSMQKLVSAVSCLRRSGELSTGSKAEVTSRNHSAL